MPRYRELTTSRMTTNSKEIWNMTVQSFDVAIIGTGTAGMAAPHAANLHGVSAALIEGDQCDTTCTQVGCMPSKLLIAAAETVHNGHHSVAFGDHVGTPKIDGKATIAQRRSPDSSTLTSVLRRIEASGLVTRTRNPENEWQVRIHFAKLGRDLRTKVGSLRKALVDATGMSTERLIEISKEVDALRDRLK